MTTEPRTDSNAEVGMTLVGDPTLEDCDKAQSAFIDLVRAIADEAGAPDLKLRVQSVKVTCGICEGGPVTWVATKRKKKIVRLARCAEHRQDTLLPDLVVLQNQVDHDN